MNPELDVENCGWCKDPIEGHEPDEAEECLQHLTMEVQELCQRKK